MSSLLHMLLLICCLFHSGVSQNSKITCPRPFYKEGSSALNLTIDSSTFSGCNIGPASVTCSWYPETGTESVICIQSVTSCDQTLTNRGCRCNSVSGQVYDYSLSFSMLPGEERGNISCSLDCIVSPGNPGPKATVESDQKCLNIDFDSKCETFGCQQGVCRIDGTEPICDCSGTDYEGTYCEDKSETAEKAFNWLIIGVVFIIGFGSGLFTGVGFACICNKKRVKVLGTNVKFLSGDNKQEFIDTLQDKTSSSLKVNIFRHSTENLTAVVFESRNLHHLNVAQRETPSLIASLKSTANHEPIADYPPGRPMPQPKYTGKGNGGRT